MTEIHGHMCGPKVYEFEGVKFEYSDYNGPYPLKKNGDPKMNPDRKFYDLFDRFNKLTEEEKKKRRIGGGCISF